MKRHLLVLVALLTCSGTLAQSSYFGIQLSGIVGAGSVFPFFELQVDVPVAENVELRISGLPLLLVNILQVDLFYSSSLSDMLRVYGGVGGDVGSVAFYDDGSIFGVHATAGLEYGLGSGVGLFGEVQPLYVVHAPGYLLSGNPDSGLGFFGKLNLGINFHF